MIPAGQLSGSVTVTAVQELIDEPNETIIVDITGVTNASESGTQQQIVSITDDDDTLAARSDVAGWNTTTGRWYFGEYSGSGINQVTGPLWSAAAGWDIHEGDFAGDGVMDIAGRTDGGAWYVIDGVSKRSSFWGNWGRDAASRWNDPNVQGIVGVADMNLDGKDDVIGKNWRGEFYVSLSTGTGFSNSIYWGRVAQLGWVGHKFGDFNGDGKADIAGVRQSDGAWFLQQSTLQVNGSHRFTGSLFGIWTNFTGINQVFDGINEE